MHRTKENRNQSCVQRRYLFQKQREIQKQELEQWLTANFIPFGLRTNCASTCIVRKEHILPKWGSG